MNEGWSAEGEEQQPERPQESNQPPLNEGRDSPRSLPANEGNTDVVKAACNVAGRGPGSTAEFQALPIPLARGLASLRHRDFRLFWFSQLVSLIGTWMQVLGQGWLVLVIGGTALDLGMVSALQFLPILLLSLFGGFLADAFPKRYLLLFTQSASMILAFVLAALTWTGVVSITHVMILAALLGLVNALDMPTRQAFIIELVNRRDLPNAVALNSAVFNAARLVGPAVAGLAIAWLGLAPVFLLNGISFLPVVFALLAMRAGSTTVADMAEPRAIWGSIREGLRYVLRSPGVLTVIAVVAVVATFGMNFSVIAPVYAREVLNVGADGFGILMSVMGLGSLVASLLLAFLQWQPHPRLLIASAMVFGLLEVVLSWTADFISAAFLLGAIGFAMIILTTVANTTLQTSTPDHLRGRVMSVYTTVFLGTTPFGSLFTGVLAHMQGVSAPLFVGGALSAGAALAGWLQMIRSRR